MDSKGKPIPFITIDSNGAFTISPEAMICLDNFSSKRLAVVTIAGPYRSGKSFLCNRLLNQ